MKQWFALSAIGRDRPGIVADLAELIYECDCNLEDSSMTILGSEFAVLLLLTGEASRHRPAAVGGVQAAGVGEAADGLLPAARRRSRFPTGRSHHARATRCRRSGRTRPASSRSCRAAWPTSASTSRRCRPSRGASRSRARRSTPCSSLMDVPRDVDEQALRERLEGVARELCVEVTLERREA